MSIPRRDETPPCEIYRVNDDLLVCNDQFLNSINGIAYQVNPKPNDSAGPSYVWQHASVEEDGQRYFTGAYISSYMIAVLVQECRKIIAAYDEMNNPNESVRFIRNPHLEGVVSNGSTE